MPSTAVAIHEVKGNKESSTDLPVRGGPSETCLNWGRRGKVAKVVALDNGSWVSSLCQGEGIFSRFVQCF